MVKNSYNDSYEKKFGFDIKLHSSTDDKQKISPLEKAKPKPKPKTDEEKTNIFV